jgi:hypothetical protein
VAAAGASAAWLLRGIDHRFISFSDGAYLYAASIGAAHGVHALYQSVTLSLPPAPIVAAVLLWKASPHVETIRAALAGLGLVTALLCFRLARTTFGLSVPLAALAAFVAVTAPVHAQFVGLEGEALLTPLALALALTLGRGRDVASTFVLGFGFLVKLTWAPFFVAGVVAVALRSGWRRGCVVGLSAVASAAALYGATIAAFHWSAHDLLLELVLAQSASGFQVHLLVGVLAVLVVVWWPFLPFVPAALRCADTSTRCVIAGAAACSAFTLKQGTFFNVLGPLEPFLAIAGVAGARAFWSSTRLRSRVVVAVCAIGVAAHIATVGSGAIGRAVPLPLGAAIVDTDNQASVDRLASVVAAHSTSDELVLVNPFIALAAHRKLPADAADWFILRSLERYCRAHGGREARCTQWGGIKRVARRGAVAVVGVDANVVAFDRSFRRDTRASGMMRAFRIDRPPLDMELFVRR